MASPAGEKWLDVFDTPYSNGSNTAANGLFLGLICLSLLASVAIAWRKRRFIPYTFVLCMAYVFQIWTYALRFQGWSFSIFSIQYGLATITPVFVTIAIHLATAEAIAVLGATHAPLSPAAHLRTFIWTDIASLCIQSLGLSLTFSGARAAGPWGLMLPARAHTGQTILFAGLLLHTLSLAASLVVLAVTYVRAASRANSGSNNNYNDKHAYTSTTTTTRASLITALSPRCKLFLAALPLAAACVLVRCAYRAAAAWGGLGSPIARDQLLWLVAEGALLTEAMVSLAAFHPALCLCLDGGNERTQDLEAGRSGGIMGDDDNNKRYSAAGAISKTTLSTTSSSPERGEMRMMQQHEEEGDAAEAMLAPERNSRVIFSSNVMMAPPSDAGSSSSTSASEEEALWSRAHARASVGTVLDADPYYRYEDPFATPQEEEEDEGHSPYNGRFFEDAADDHIALPGSRDNNTTDEDRFETESFVEPPRKSSKRLSRAQSPPSSAAITAQEGYLAAEAEGLMGSPSRSGSVVLSPPRKSSKRLSQQQQPAAPVRGLSVRTEEEDRLEVASIMLPSRKPSKMSTMHGGEDLDAVSLYSQ